MFDLEASLCRQLREVMTHRQTLIFPEGDDPRTVTAASRLLSFANVILVSARGRAEEMIDRAEVSLACPRKRFFDRVRFVDPATDALADRFAGHLVALSRGKSWELSAAQAAARAREPVYFAIMAVYEGYADAVLGGLTHASRDFFTPCLRLFEKEGTVYEMGLFALPDEHPADIYHENLVMFADVALSPVPTTEALVDIAVGACRTLRDLIPVETLPEVNGALLSYSTRGSGAGPSVERIRAAEPLIAARLATLRECDPAYSSINIVTEMQISAAVSQTAARTKLKDDFAELKGAGRANVLIVPNLDVGNLLYHIYDTRFPDAQSTLIIGGLRNQALDFSRSSNVDDVVRGALALLLRRFRSGRDALTPHDRFFPRYRVLAINPGSTSTKVALFEGEALRARADITHSATELNSCAEMGDQLPLRQRTVEAFVADNGITLSELHAVVGRGGLLRPVEGGTYAIDDAMVRDLEGNVGGTHPSNLGGLMARALATAGGVPAFVVDPPVVDELDPPSRVTGLRGVDRIAAWHALSQKAAAKTFADRVNREYEELDLIVAHLGGGISVGAHRHGRCVRVKNALFDGPMTPNRSGTLPGRALIDLCFSGQSREAVERQLLREGGMISHLGTHDLREVERRVDVGDADAAAVLEAMVEQIAAEISACVPKFKGHTVDHIVLTGSLCYSARLCAALRRDLAPLQIEITIYPGEREMEALRDGAQRVLSGVEPARRYLG